MQHGATVRVVFKQIRIDTPDGPQPARGLRFLRDPGSPRIRFRCMGHARGRANAACAAKLKDYEVIW